MITKFNISELSANPHYSGHIHRLKFGENQTVELVHMVRGPIALASGKYSILEESDSSAKLQFFDLIEKDSYRQNQKIRDLAPFELEISREEGSFPLAQDDMDTCIKMLVCGYISPSDSSSILILSLSLGNDNHRIQTTKRQTRI